MPLPRLTHQSPFCKLQALVAASEAEYKAPPPSGFDEYLEKFERPKLEYGHEVLSHFALDPSIIFLNHGSLGACPKAVMQVRQKYVELHEFEPIKFVEDSYHRIAHVNRVVAKYVNARPEQIVLVLNASAASTCVLLSFPFQPKSTVLSFDLEYGAVVRQIKHATKSLKHRVIRTSAPYTAASILNAFNSALEECAGETIGLVVVDHITSESGLILPVQVSHSIIKLVTCHFVGYHQNLPFPRFPVLVDGAHAIGQIPLDLGDLQPDFYLSNFHKWILAPKSAAFLYIREPNKYTIDPPIISHGHTLGTAAGFGYTGTVDYSAYLSVPASLAFHTKMGGVALMKRNHDLCVTAAQKLAAAWKTTLLTPEVDTMIGSICVVLLPKELFQDAEAAHLLHDLETLHLVLRQQYHIEVKTALVGGAPGLRISVQMYNQQADYDALERAVLELVSRDAGEIHVQL